MVYVVEDRANSRPFGPEVVYPRRSIVRRGLRWKNRNKRRGTFACSSIPPRSDPCDKGKPHPQHKNNDAENNEEDGTRDGTTQSRVKISYPHFWPFADR
jgi:hypothetical protein